ncbi:hypothetical protein NDA01_14865 [Trichocoleus desertorum AS-A10]|uniref:hypothetical protein n=1 Tax=Trichocoleus desertorum TaxID=1481672 RepID=UPI00329C383E
MRSNFDELNSHSLDQQDRGLSRIAKRLAQSLERDALVQKTTDELRQMLQADRVVLYYFYQRWKGQVTFESLNAEHLSIFGINWR